MPPTLKKNTIWLIGGGEPGTCVAIDGHGDSRADARKAAYDFLVAKEGWDVERADEATDNASVARAWWGGDKYGFVQLDHPEARPVSVVNLNVSEGEVKA